MDMSRYGNRDSALAAFRALDLTDATRPIRLRVSTAKGVVDDSLLVKHVSGVESICGGIEYSVLCLSSHPGMELKQFIANPVEVQFVTDTGKLRTVCGIVGGAAEGQSDGGLATYQLIVRDAFSLLEQTKTGSTQPPFKDEGSNLRASCWIRRKHFTLPSRLLTTNRVTPITGPIQEGLHGTGSCGKLKKMREYKM
jgi:hypothetical protein